MSKFGRLGQSKDVWYFGLAGFNLGITLLITPVNLAELAAFYIGVLPILQDSYV